MKVELHNVPAPDMNDWTKDNHNGEVCADIAQWDELADQLTKLSEDICELNGCTKDNHNCESYAYIAQDGTLVDVCGSDYFQGWGSYDVERHGDIAAVMLPWSGTGQELWNEVDSQMPF